MLAIITVERQERASPLVLGRRQVNLPPCLCLATHKPTSLAHTLCVFRWSEAPAASEEAQWAYNRVSTVSI